MWVERKERRLKPAPDADVLVCDPTGALVLLWNMEDKRAQW